jgi:hypothetical protein
VIFLVCREAIMMNTLRGTLNVNAINVPALADCYKAMRGMSH